jgi:mannitol-1-phosphate 5-dehydrogenase
LRAVVIGAGRIGCGLVAEALRNSGHEVVFVARSTVLTDHLNRVGRYRLRLLNGRQSRETEIDGVRAVCVTDTHHVVEELGSADLVAACLRPHSLPRVAPLIAAGLLRRSRPTNVLTLENTVDAGPALRSMVASHLPSGWDVDQHGFSGALAARVVSRRLGDPATDEPLTFVGDLPGGFVVDRRALRGGLPDIADVAAIDEYPAAVRHKLYTFSAGHAVAAYLGFLKGYQYIHTAVRDTEVRLAVMGAMDEGRAGLSARYASRPASIESDPAKIIARFDNAGLDDSVLRVGRDPQRKLASADRLVGAATLAEEAGVRPERLALATAAALCFEHVGDPSSTGLQLALRRAGVHEVLRRVSRLDATEGFGRNVAVLWSRLSTGRREGNHLLTLKHLTWAWASSEAGLNGAPARVPR